MPTRCWFRARIACLVALCLVPSGSAAAGADEVIVAVIDTGIRPTHQEFEFGGPDDPNDQIVAWWDFTNEDLLPSVPEPGVLWDERNPIPFDDDGHGTATAAMAVGRNVAPAAIKAPSFAPGAKLAVARACDATGSCYDDWITNAILWATNTVGADVISISASAQLPTGNVRTRVHEAARVARRNGALVVVANGNGLASSTIVPEPGLLVPFGDSPEVLGVGGDGAVFEYGLTTDPELVAAFLDVPIAARTCDACHGVESGTSLSAPLVAGMAAEAIRTARANDHDLDPDELERLLKYSARDTEAPPWTEGYGVLDAAAFQIVRAHAAAGTLPARPDPDPNAVYVDTVAFSARTAATQADGASKALIPLGIDPGTGPQRLGHGTLTGIIEIERYQVSAPEGAHVIARAALQPAGQDLYFVMYGFEGDPDPAWTWNDMVAWNRTSVTSSPWLSVRSHGEPITIVVAHELTLAGATPVTYELEITGGDSMYHSDDLAVVTTLSVFS